MDKLIFMAGIFVGIGIELIFVIIKNFMQPIIGKICKYEDEQQEVIFMELKSDGELNNLNNKRFIRLEIDDTLKS